MKKRYGFLVILLLSLLQLYAQCPDPSGLGTSNLGPSSVILSWTSGGASNWQIQFDTIGFNLGDGTIFETNTNPVTLINLLPETSYEFYVRDSCGIGNFSNWVGPFLFTTTELFTVVNSGIPDISYSNAEWGDYDNDGDLDILIMGIGVDNTIKIYQNNNTDSFTEIDIGIPYLIYGSISWGDYDNDGDLDIAMAGNDMSSWEKTAKIYRNDGGNSFVDLNLDLIDIEFGSADWGDFDNDGDLDLLLVGESSTDNIGKIYENEGNDVFTDANAEIKACANGDIACADYNNDNYIDIIMSGKDINGNRHTTLYSNNGEMIFSEINTEIEDAKEGSLIWGDYDQDGDLDLFMCGISRFGRISVIYRNDGDNIFTDINVEIIAVETGFAAWGDYDNDGDLDLVLSGINDWATPRKIWIELYRNDGNDIFTNIDANLKSVYHSANIWGDYDNDGDLDLLVTGEDSIANQKITRLYRNNILFSNSKPEPPSNLNSIDGTSVKLSWIPGSDTETSQSGLSYNLKVGTSIENFEIVSSMSDTVTGYRRIVKLGNMNLDTSWTLHNLDTGKYYWSVQTIDNAFEASEFAPIDSFNILLSFIEINAGLQQLREGQIDWGDYDNDNDLDILLSGSYYKTDESKYIGVTKIYQNNLNDSFVDKTEISLTGVSGGSSVWVDYDNDGDLDILLTGAYERYPNYVPVSKIYRNDGGDSFIEISVDLPDSPLSLGDYDNDGDIDIYIQGKIYQNDNGEFTYTNINIGGNIGAWGDYDNDGDLDLLSASNPVSTIYRNDGPSADGFTEQTDITLAGIISGSATWGDYDNDGDLDVFLAGFDVYYDVISKVYRNDGNNVFVDINSNIRSISEGEISLGDYNNDGWIDLLVAGQSGTSITKVYKNNKDQTFTDINAEIIGLRQGTVNWCDYDNDGDLDVSMVGIDDGYNNISRIYRNNINISKNQLLSPQNLLSEPYGYGINIFWSESSDIDNMDIGYSFNIRIGTTKYGNEIMSSMSNDTTGYRRISTMGNVQTNTSWRIDSLPEGKYYWSVQAIDQGFTGGEWSPIDSFNITVVRAYFCFDTICFGDSTHFYDESVSSGNTINSWLWNFGDGTISTEQNPVHLYNTPGFYTVLLTAYTSEHENTTTSTVYVKPVPEANFSATTECLLDGATSFTNLSSIDTIAISEWYWDYGDGNNFSGESPTGNLYLTSGNFNAKFKISAQNGCTDSITKTVYVGEYPNAAITSNLPLEFCEGDSTILSVDYNQNYNYQWMLNDTDITDADSSKFTAKILGNYKVEVINNIGNCITISSGVDVNAESSPISPFINYTGNTTFCRGDSIKLSVTNNTSLDYQWKLNGGAIGVDTNLYIAKLSGNYTLDVSNAGGCMALSSNSVDVTVNEVPDKPVVSLSGLTGFCEGDSLILSADEHAGLTYQWCNENGEILNADSNQYVTYSSGSFYLDITNSSNCTNTSNTTNVTVSEMPLKPVINTTGYDINDCPQEKLITLSVDQPTVQYDYQWKRNGVPIDGETGSSIEDYLKEGDYSVIAGNNGCANESDITGIYYDPELPEKPGIIATGPNVWYLACTNDKAQQYEWYYNNEIISGANNYLYVANQTLGTYFVKIAEENGCFVSSDAVTIPLTATGIDDVNPFAGLKIYPNPTPGMFTIEMDNNLFGELITRIFSQNAVEILNIKFEKSTQHFIAHVDLSGQGKGVYLISFTLDKYKAERKIVVE